MTLVEKVQQEGNNKGPHFHLLKAIYKLLARD